jgi:hypothetical protein
MIGIYSRRAFLRSSAVALLAARVRPAHSDGAENWTRYNEIVVIDAQGSLLGRGVPLARALEDSKASGVTAVNITLGTTEREGLFEKTIAGIGEWEARLAAHPDRLLKIRSARDIETAKASGRLGIIYGFQARIVFPAISSVRCDCDHHDRTNVRRRTRASCTVILGAPRAALPEPV